MASPPQRSEGSFRRGSQLSRRTSNDSAHTNIFSDDFALEPADSAGDLTPVHSLQDSVDFTPTPSDNNTHPSSHHPRSAVPTFLTSLDRPPSVSKRFQPTESSSVPQRAVSAVTSSDAATRRTLSSSSRFSIPRSPSPYNGPTAPSQPYAMYPQVTRASSIGSESTLRPQERPFIAHSGPEHPYAMYQNNVPEEEDDDVSPHLSPLGFPALGSSFREGSSSSGNDTGDIVGSDGHVEQLPPYSRYADNVIAKGDMARIEPPASSLVESSTAASDPATSDSALELNRPQMASMQEEQVARKEGWIARGKKRRCCGMPLFAVILIVIVVLGAAAIGGIIGGIIGNDRGTERAIASSAATTTVWLDADPVATGPSTPSCPTGQFIIPLNQTQQINSCIADPDDYDLAWDCMDMAFLGLSLTDFGPGQPYKVAFEDYSNRPQLFQYGPQPPDFNGSAFELNPVKDKEDVELGVAMFFSHLFDKLIILEADALNPIVGHKRSVPVGEIRRRQNFQTPKFLAVADQPWYCFWNATIEEFWIFLEKDIDHSMTSSSTSIQTATFKSMVTTAPTSLPVSPSPSTYNKAYTPPPTSAQPASTASPTYDPYWAGPKAKRGSPYEDSDPSPNFPKLVKMVEKRKPHGNIQPYCQKMQVLDNWQIMPIPTVPTICIEESEFAQPTGSKSKRWTPRRRYDSTEELESNCICEWFSHPLPL